MPERNDRNTQACRHSHRRCAAAGQAEATNKSLNRKKRPARTSGPGRKALLSLTQRESPNTRKPGSRIATIRPPRNSAPATPMSSAHHTTQCAIATRVAAPVRIYSPWRQHIFREDLLVPPEQASLLKGARCGLACVLADAFVKH